MDLLGNIPAIIAGIAALVAFIWGKGKLDRRKGRQEGVREVRRRAQVSADARKETRNEIDDDVSGGDAINRLRSDWTRD